MTGLDQRDTAQHHHTAETGAQADRLGQHHPGDDHRHEGLDVQPHRRGRRTVLRHETKSAPGANARARVVYVVSGQSRAVGPAAVGTITCAALALTDMPSKDAEPRITTAAGCPSTNMIVYPIVR